MLGLHVREWAKELWESGEGDTFSPEYWAAMSNPETALKNAVFEYLLSTNNIKSAETFFKESNLETHYNVPVDVVIHKAQLHGTTCLICRLFNNWYSFAQNQLSITTQPSPVFQDDTLVHMQQFLDFYHIHDKSTSPPPDLFSSKPIDETPNHTQTYSNVNLSNITSNNNTTPTNINANNNNDITNTSTNPSNTAANINTDGTKSPVPKTRHTHRLNSPSPTILSPIASPTPTPRTSHPSEPHDHTHSPHCHTHNIIRTHSCVSHEVHDCHDQTCTFMQDLDDHEKTNVTTNTTNKNINITNNITTIHNVNNSITTNKTKSATNTLTNKTSNNMLYSGNTLNTATINNTSNYTTNTSNMITNIHHHPHANISPKTSTPIPTSTNSPKNTTLNAENEYLFSVGQKLFSTSHHHHSPNDPITSDSLLQLLTLDTLNFVSPPFSPSSTSPSLSSSPALSEKDETGEQIEDLAIDVDMIEPKAGRFCCPFPDCSKSFSTLAILKRHIKEHSGDRPFRCHFEGCGKGFARNYDLKVHMRSHTGEKPYKCTFMGCERTFSRSSDLRLHERIHKGEKPFVCDCEGCQKRFVRYADLKKHKRTHEVHEGHHPHTHGVGCGHTAIAHEDHIDYLHDAHMHNIHKGHIDDHTIGATDSNPVACTHPNSAFACDPTHVHNDSCGHELVPHSDHYDYLVDGHLHYVHDSHCDDHGWIDIVNWNPSDFPLDTAPPPDHSL